MKRSKHSLSHYKLLSMNMGNLVPVALTEVLPGDSFKYSTSLLLRCSPLVAPVMHPVHVRIHHWFVPTRLIWEDFQDFITGGEDGMNDSVPPFITAPADTGFDVGTLADYLGVPPAVPDIEVSALPFRAYNMIWNEWYRDQDLQEKKVFSLASGEDTTTALDLLNVAWEKDYFTSSRPWPQKGPDVVLPFAQTAPVTTSPTEVTTGAQAQLQMRNVAGGLPASGRTLGMSTTGGISITGDSFTASSGVYPTNLIADLSEASGLTVNQLREALSIQRYAEHRARYGSRYTEYLRYLGVRSSDARLQRPEYLGGGKTTIQFSEVLQTAEGIDPVGALKGHGIAAARSNSFVRFFEEHGYCLTFISVRPKTMYTQGLNKLWSRKTKEDYWQKELEHIGQQEVLNSEIYAAATEPDGVFGYQDRYDEYRRVPSSIAGEFRTSELNFWHMARNFVDAPVLNADFVESNPTKRVFAVPSEDVLYVMASHNIKARRLLSSRGSSFTY